MATGDRVLLFDVKTGALVRAWPDGGQSPQGFGRGILAGERIYWPTENEIHVLDQETGLRAEPPIKLNEIVPRPKRREPRRRRWLPRSSPRPRRWSFSARTRPPDRAVSRGDRPGARSERRAITGWPRRPRPRGWTTSPSRAYEQVVRRARPSEAIDGVVLADSSRDHQHTAPDASREKPPARRTTSPAAAARFARRPPRFRSRRIATGSGPGSTSPRAELRRRQGTPAPAVSTLQALLGDERLRPLVVASERRPQALGPRRPADLRPARRQIVRERPPGILRRVRPGSPRALLDRGVKKGRDPRLLADVGRSYPAAMRRARCLASPSPGSRSRSKPAAGRGPRVSPTRSCLGRVATTDPRPGPRLLGPRAGLTKISRGSGGPAQGGLPPGRCPVRRPALRGGPDRSARASLRLADRVAERLREAAVRPPRSAKSAEPSIGRSRSPGGGAGSSRPRRPSRSPPRESRPRPARGGSTWSKARRSRAVDPATGSPTWTAEPRDPTRSGSATWPTASIAASRTEDRRDRPDARGTIDVAV